MPRSVEKKPSKIIKATVKFVDGRAVTGWFYPEVEDLLKKAGMVEEGQKGSIWCG
jgi:hypothetical protein